jgi:hypothetical protein
MLFCFCQVVKKSIREMWSLEYEIAAIQQVRSSVQNIFLFGTDPFCQTALTLKSLMLNVTLLSAFVLNVVAPLLLLPVT